MFPNASKDEHGRLQVGAAIGVGSKGLARAAELIKTGVDVVVIDTAHGHSKGVLETARKFKKKFPKVNLIAGNVGTEQAAKDLIDAGVDGI